MFGRNEIVGKKQFVNEARLLVTSIFVTLQGEGPFSGCPAVFVRLAKCNLACSFCDTFFDDGDWYTPQELRAAIGDRIYKYFQAQGCAFTPRWADYYPGWKRDMVLVITGGEPSLQPALSAFCLEMHDEFENVQIESNGILVQDGLPDETYLVVSPKCLEKDGRAVNYLKPNPEMLERADCLKFVMSADPASPYHTIPDWAFEWQQLHNKLIFVSPMNVYLREPQKAKQARAENQTRTLDERSTIDEVVSFWEEGLLDRAQNEKNHEYTARYALRHGLRLSLQTHLYAGLA